jgi:protein Cut8
VRHALSDLLEALSDFTPHFLPPHEIQTATSLSYLDGATKVIHELPEWENQLHRTEKNTAYEEISKAWALVISEAAKRGGGIQLQYGGWDQKLAKHNEISNGKMTIALNALSSNLGWMVGSQTIGGTGDTSSIRQQLLSGTYGADLSV